MHPDSYETSLLLVTYRGDTFPSGPSPPKCESPFGAHVCELCPTVYRQNKLDLIKVSAEQRINLNKVL